MQTETAAVLLIRIGKGQIHENARKCEQLILNLDVCEFLVCEFLAGSCFADKFFCCYQGNYQSTGVTMSYGLCIEQPIKEISWSVHFGKVSERISMSQETDIKILSGQEDHRKTAAAHSTTSQTLGNCIWGVPDYCYFRCVLQIQ